MNNINHPIDKADELIYQNINTYRLHADNLRWTLLGGYAAFLAATLSLLGGGTATINSVNPLLALLLTGVSFAYLWILAVQNWFYNLFARFVDDCEYRLVSGVKLRTLQDFAGAQGHTVSPFHPAFYLAELIVGTATLYFFSLFIINLDVPGLTEAITTLPRWASTSLWVILIALYFGTLHYLWRHWDRIVFRRIIRPLSNLYKPVQKDKESKAA